MYNINEKYKQVLKSNEQQYDAYIILEDGTKVDSDISGLKPIFNLGEKIIGNFVAKRVEFTLFNTSKYNITNKEFEVFIGIKIDNEFNYTSLGKFIANKPEIKDEAQDECSIVAQNYSLKFKVQYEPILIFPCTIKEAIKRICEHLNIVYVENDFINSNYVLEEFFIDEDATFFDVIKILVEAGFANADINNSNSLIVKSPSKTINYTFSLNELFELKKEDNKFGPINSIVASRIVADDGSTTEDVFARNETSITKNGLYEYKIKQNDAIDYDRQTAVNNILNGILDFEYIPATIETVYNPAAEVGDIFEVPDVKADTSFLLFAKEISADLSTGLMTIESTEETQTQTDYKSATNKDKRRKTEAKINKLEGEITLLTQETTENTEKIASIEMDLDSITTRVGNTETKVTSVETIANNAINSATEANSMASNAQETANNASTVANSVKDIAETANSTANTAKEKAEEASAAAEDANLVATNAQEIANSVKSTAENANETANTASTNAANALDIANEAKNTADKAESTADTANTTASNAKEVAENASNIADSAISTANTANSNATTAMNTASEAQSMADSAKTTADEALENANNTTIEMNEKYTEIKSTTESITNTVSDIKEVTNNIDGSIVEIEKSIDTLEQTINGLENTLETQGGSNLLLNSSGLFGNEHWEGNVKALTNTDIQNNFIAKACFDLQNGSMKQTIEVVNGTYYIGFKYQKLLELASCKVLINGIEKELTETNLTEVNNYIEVSEHGITIELVSDTDNACLIGDIIIVKGSKQSWSSNMNEIYTSTVKIGIGLEIVSNTMKTKLLANADGVRIVNTINNKVTSEFTDKGMKTDELEANTAKIARILIQDINKQTWISRY